MKRCAICKEVKADTEFAKSKHRLHAYCKPCFSRYRKVRRKGGVPRKFVRDPQRLSPKEIRLHDRYRALLRKYGISKQEYETRLEIQGGGCAICGLPPSSQKYGVLQVDHDHSTGKTRGLLCFNCNSGLGHFEDGALLLRSAADYLDSYE